MAVSAFAGPVIAFGQSPFTPLEYNPDLAPSMFFGGVAILDPRAPYTYLPGESQSQVDYGFAGSDNVTTIQAVPYTASTSAIVASANPTSTSLALVSANSATTGVYVTPSVARADTGAVDTGVNGAGLVALDAFTSVTASCTNGVLTITANTAMPVAPGMALISASGAISSGQLSGTIILSQITGGSSGTGTAGTYQLSNSSLTFASGTVTFATPNPTYCVVPFGTTQSGGIAIAMWNPQTLIARAVSITAAAAATATLATVSGYDVYGYPMVENITVTAGSTTNGKKAFKYIRSVVLNATDTTHAYSVGTQSVFGLPLHSDTFGDLTVNSAASYTALTLTTAATGYVNGDNTVPTATTGDVRGTYSGFTAATGTNKLVIRQSPPAQNLGSASGLFGPTQFANF